MRLAFTVNTDPNGLDMNTTAELLIGEDLGGGEVGTGVTLDWRRGDASKPVMRLEAFDDGFRALADLAPLFAWLAARKGPTSLAQTKAKLKKLGLVEIPAH